MATASAFSYAQAAKGQGTLASNTSPSPTPQPQEGLPAAAETQAATPVEHSTEPHDAIQNSDIRTSSLEKQDVASNIGSEAEGAPESVPETAREFQRDDDMSRLDRPWRRNDKSTRSSSTTTRSVDEPQEARRTRKSKKSKASDKQSNEQAAVQDQEPEQEAPKVALLEAPIPSVNIWQQRKEAQLAKVKPSVTESVEPIPDGLPKAEMLTKASENEATAIISQTEGTSSGVKNQRKPGETTRPERNASRGSRLVEKESKDVKTELPPSVADSAAWPTPEISIKEDKKKPAEKTERIEKDASEDGATSKPRQKEKWVTYDYVPTVNFETQLPQMRSSKPRGGARSANGLRTTGTPHSGDKASPTASQTKFNENKERSRDGANGSNRSAPSLQVNKRASADLSNTREQRKPAAQSGSDKAKDVATSTNDNGQATRERPEGRGERTRGGYRGRGGHHPINTQHQHQNSTSSFSASGALGGRIQGPYSPPPRQSGHGQLFMAPQRGGRGGRNSGTNFHRLSLPNGASRIAPVQTQFGPYDYPMAPMTAVPFQPQPYWDNVMMPVLKNQIEYYFSIENLCKDMYLRARMDSQGFVPLHFIAAFKRVRELSADSGMVRAVCEMSTELDLVVGEDDIERVRRTQAWENFVLPMEERDDFARNNGPSHLTFKNRSYQMAPQFDGMAVPYGVSTPSAYGMAVEAPFQQVSDESFPAHRMNGFANGHVNGQVAVSQLSADVPDFSPSGSTLFGDQPKFGQSENGKFIGNSYAVNGQTNEPTVNGLPNGVHANEQS